MRYPQAIAKLKELAHEMQNGTDSYAEQVAQDEFNLIALAFDVPEVALKAILNGSVDTWGRRASVAR